MNKADIMEKFIFFCRDYGILGSLDPAGMVVSFCSKSLSWVNMDYDTLQKSFPDIFPELEPEHLEPVQDKLF